MRFTAIVFVLVAVLALASAEEGIFKVSEYQNFFTNFMTKFKKTFSAAAVKLKLEIFKKNVDKVTQHNANKKAKFQLAINQFADLSSDEFKKMYLGLKAPASAYRSLLEAKSALFDTPQAEIASLMELSAEADAEGDDKPKKKTKKEIKAEEEAAAKAAAEKKKALEDSRREAAARLEEERAAHAKAQADRAAKEAADKAAFEAFAPIDWVKAGNVGAPKHQGSCGSCWSFATIATVESALSIKHGIPAPVLSEQSLVNCDTSNNGCNGGWYSGSFKFVVDKGVFSDASWPYKAKKEACDIASRTKDKYSITSSQNLYGSDQALYAALRVGPAAVALDASDLQLYKSGYFNASCSTSFSTFVNHAVVLVGSGTDGTQKYWKIRNSWGSSWGENGYFKLPVTGTNNCGIHVAAYNAIV